MQREQRITFFLKFTHIVETYIYIPIFSQLAIPSYSKSLCLCLCKFETLIYSCPFTTFEVQCKWKAFDIIDSRWEKFIAPNDTKPGKMYGLVKTHKVNNPARVITSGCGTPLENLSIFVEKHLYKEVLKIDTRIQDTPHMLNIIDEMNQSNRLDDTCILVSFDVVNMFPSIDNATGIEAVRDILENRSVDFPPTDCIIEALSLCLRSNNSIFNGQHYLQEDGTAQGPHMSCSYSDIAMYLFDLKALNYPTGVICWKRFRDDVIVVWNDSRSELDQFLYFLNTIDSKKKIQFTMNVAENCALEFLDLQLFFDKTSHTICVDVYAKPTNSFTYVLPSTCYPRKNIEKVPEGVALRLRRICDNDEKFDNRSIEYQKYLIARDYKPHLVKKQFLKSRNITRCVARQPREKGEYKVYSLLTQYNPILPDLNGLIRKHLPLLYSEPNMKDIFPDGSVKAMYKRGKNLREMLSPSLFPTSKRAELANTISKCDKRCDICATFMIFEDQFKCTATGKYYRVKGALHCNSKNVIYLITCFDCKKQYVGSATNFKERFRVHKSDIKTNKERCGVAKHFINSCNTTGKFNNVKVQLIETVVSENPDKLDSKLWQREKYWQAQLFTMSHGLNSTFDWYSTNRKGYRK